MAEHDSLSEEEARRMEVGLELVARLHGVLRAGRLYDSNNRSFRQQLEDFTRTLGGDGADEVTLVCMGDYFYVDGVRLKPRPSQLGLFRALREEFERHELGALRFMPGLGLEELLAFLGVYGAASTPARLESLPADLAEAGVLRLVVVRARDIRTVAPEATEAPTEASGERGRARQNFWRAVSGTRSILTRASQTGRPALRQVRRLVQPIVDSILKDEYSIVGLTAIKEHDEYTFVHCVNVSVLSVAIGSALRLPRPTLANLGVAALLHDLGKLSVPPDVLHKPGQLSPAEWRQVESHPIEGVKMMANMPGLSALMVDAMRVSYEHHMNVDGTGYPAHPAPQRTSVLSRVVAVADVFDALTAHRAYRARPFTGYEALSIMLGPERAHADPAALWGLLQSVGLYPAGTLMVTRSGYTVLSMSPNSQDTRRPFCRVVGRPGETRWSLTEERWDPMPADEHVERVLSPEEHRLPVEEMLAA